MKVSMTVNGQQVSGDVEPRTLLVHFIREELALTGTHVGCETSYCGACTIHLEGEATKSCTMLAVQAEAPTSPPSRVWQATSCILSKKASGNGTACNVDTALRA